MGARVWGRMREGGERMREGGGRGEGGKGFMKGSEEHSRVGGDREINPAKRNLRGSRKRGGRGDRKGGAGSL